MTKNARHPATGRLGFGAWLVVVLVAADSQAQELLMKLELNRGVGGDQDFFGASVGSLEDLDGDGLREWVVSAPYYNVIPSKQTNEGAVFVLSSKDGSVMQQSFGHTSYSVLGWSLDSGGDVDGDGIEDYVAGEIWEKAPGKAAAGGFRVVSGATGLEHFSVVGERAGDQLGWDVAIVDDVDGDGARDVVTTALFWDASKTLGAAGRGYCYSGRTGILLWTHDGTRGGQGLGYCAAIADVSGDGVGDVAFGSVGGGSGTNGEGEVEFVDGVTGLWLSTIVGENPGDFFGLFIAGIGDVDRDGLGDVMVAATSFNGPPALCGRVYVYSSRTLQKLYTVDGTQYQEHLGALPAGSPFDVDDDGVGDFAIGSGLLQVDGADDGVARLYSGRTGRILYEFRSLKAYGAVASYGESLAFIDDANGDGFEDFIVGASAVPNSWGNGVGAAYVMSCRNRFLQANQIEYQSGDAIDIDLRGGTPGVLGLIAVVDIDGTPVFHLLSLAALDGNGELRYSDVADPSLAGFTVGLVGLTQRSSGRGSLSTTVEAISFK